MSRLGNQLRVAGTGELGGADMRLDTPTARARCEMLLKRVEELMPGVCDTRLPEEGAIRSCGAACVPPRPLTSPALVLRRRKASG